MMGSKLGHEYGPMYEKGHMWMHKMSSPQPDSNPLGYSGATTKSIKNKHLLDHKFDKKPK